ncbi:MAG TPA: AMP-binding protein [Steroidobacteraceae bacterium]|nr:AMP-binding protein [Steroidobacteraceae bacterium]
MTRAFVFVPPRNPQPLGQMLDVQAARDPQRPALTCGSTTLSRNELAFRSRARAHALRKAGVQEGDFVALALPTGTAVLEFAFGCWMLGATPTPLSHRLPPLELQAMLDVLKPRLAVVDEHSYFDESDADTPLPPRISQHVKAIASGGSTGRPKIIVDHTRAVLDPDAPSVGMQATDTVVVPGPMYHSAPFGLAYQALGWGCHVVIMPRFDAAETLRLVAAHRAQWLYQVPTMMHRIWSLDAARASYDVSSLEMVCHIAAACPPWLKEKWIEWLGPDRLWEVYSGTEAIGATLIGGREWLEHRGSVGRLAPGASVRILDQAGNEVAPGEVGEIYFRPAGGPGATYHYLGAEPRARGEWETFGDLGRLDPDGYLYLADRRTDLIISGGANIYPAEIEAAVDAFPGVLASVAIGLPDEDLGQRVHAIIEVRPDTTVDIDALRAFLAQRLVTYKLPRSFETTFERLRDDSGKVRRNALREARLRK